MAEEKKEAAPAAAAPDAGGGGGGGGGANKIVLIISLVNLVVCIAIAGLLFVSFKKEKEAISAKDIHAKSEEGGAEGHGDAKHAEGGDHGGGEAAAGGGEHGGGEAAGGHGGGHGEKKDSGKVFARVVTLDPFTVNLSSAGGTSPKYVRVNVALEVPTQEVEDEVKQRTPQIRNIVIDLLNSKRTSDLTNYEGREALKDEIRNAINSFLVTGRLKGVFFTNFAVSS